MIENVKDKYSSIISKVVANREKSEFKLKCPTPSGNGSTRRKAIVTVFYMAIFCLIQFLFIQEV